MLKTCGGMYDAKNDKKRKIEESIIKLRLNFIEVKIFSAPVWK